MNIEEIEKEANYFFEWSGEDKSTVTTKSAVLFAKYIAEKTRKQIYSDLPAYHIDRID